MTEQEKSKAQLLILFFSITGGIWFVVKAIEFVSWL